MSTIAPREQEQEPMLCFRKRTQDGNRLYGLLRFGWSFQSARGSALPNLK